MKKEDLFATLRANTYMQYDMPEMAIDGITYPDRLRQFVEMTESVGGHVLELGEGEDLNDAVPEAADLNGTDVGIVRGELGVAENGCVWVPQTMKEKAVCFISEYLVIVLKKTAIVDNMHEAYARIDMDPRYNFGTFISGPSKTADIEQSLVMGAQAARGVTVILV